MTLIYGHRGALAEAPENTLPSFQKALDAGVTRVEQLEHRGQRLS